MLKCVRSYHSVVGVLETFLFVILIHRRLRCLLVSRVLYISSCAALLQAPHWCYRAHWCQNCRDSITELSVCSKLFLFVILIHGRLRCFLVSRVLYISSCAALLQAPHWCYRAHWCQNFRDSITELSGCSKLFHS